MIPKRSPPIYIYHWTAYSYLMSMTLPWTTATLGKGNIPINRSMAKRIENGQIIQDLPLGEYNGQKYPLYTVLSPIICHICGSTLKVHQHYMRYIISSYGVIECPTTYWVCSNTGCRSHANDVIVGVNGSANYSNEYLEKQKYVRYLGKCSLWNSRSVGEIYTTGLTDINGRAPCPSTLWKFEQKEGVKSYEKILNLDLDCCEEIYIDGYWVKDGWKKYIEKQLGRELTEREWKKIRYKIIYTISTKDKVILDFQITNIMPSHLELIPLIKRIKDRISGIKRIVSDEDNAIINAVSIVLPDVVHSFCVFHQLKNVSRKYLDQFKTIEKIPEDEKIIYELSKRMIMSESVIESTALLHDIHEYSSTLNLSDASKKVIIYIEEMYHKNRTYLEKGLLPETNNVMEQYFSLIDDIVYQARSFKTHSGMKNFFSNLFDIFNHRSFNTGIRRGFSPIEISKLNCG
jgi:hypothetical protein